MNNFDWNSLSDTELINCCNEIYDWKRNSQGTLCQNSKLKKLYDNNPNVWTDVRHLEQQILFEAENTFHKLAALLVSEKSTIYIK